MIMKMNSDFNKIKDIPVLGHEFPVIEHSLQEHSHVIYAHIFPKGLKLLAERNLKTTNQLRQKIECLFHLLF